MTRSVNNILFVGDEEKTLPMKWCICGQCEGEGQSSGYMGAFTSDDMDQMDQDFIDDYFAGNFDRPCDACGGSGKIQEVDEERLSPEDLKAWYAQEEQRWRDHQEHMNELRAGA